MKNLSLVLAMICLCACVACDAKDQPVHSTGVPVKPCPKKVKFGSTDICVPEFSGMTECYNEPFIKELVDMFENPGNSVLAFYIEDDQFEAVKQERDFHFDEYFKIYVTNLFKDKYVNQEDLSVFSGDMSKFFEKMDQEDLDRKLRSSKIGLKIDKPIIMESYAPADEVKSMVLLTQVNVMEEETIMLCILNMMVLRDRFVWMAYYLSYDGPDSLRKAKSKNDYIALRIIQENR